MEEDTSIVGEELHGNVESEETSFDTTYREFSNFI